MKQIPILVLLMSITQVASAKDIYGKLSKYQEKSSSSKINNTSSSGETKSVSTTISASTSVSSAKCEEDDQTSIPLSRLSVLFKGDLDITHDPRKGSLTISSDKMISNCAAMIKWEQRTIDTDGKKTHIVEAKFNKDNCTPAGCKYKIPKVVDGDIEKFEEKTFAPTMKGFDKCMETSTVFKADGEVNEDGIYKSQIMEEFSGVKDTGELLFVSHGPSTTMAGPKYDKFVKIDKCDYYENLTPEGVSLVSLADEEAAKIAAEQAKKEAEANELLTCNEWTKLDEFTSKYSEYADMLNPIRDSLIREAAKKAAAAIASGSFTPEDLQTVEDFQTYIVEPAVDDARLLYSSLSRLEGENLKNAQAEFKDLIEQIKAYNKPPYFVQPHVDVLVKKGEFEAAEDLNTMRLLLAKHANLGISVNGAKYTPEKALADVKVERAEFAKKLVEYQEKHLVATGQDTGKSQMYANEARRRYQIIQVRNQNYTQSIQAEAARIQQPNGYCFAYYRNTQRCVQESLIEIERLKAELKYYNEEDMKKANEAALKSQEYSKLEAEGRRYVAGETGADVPVDTTRPTPRDVGANGVYNFDFNPGMPQAQQPQVYPQQQYNQNMFVQQNPYQYANQNYQQPQYHQPQYMGQQNYNPLNFQAGANLQLGMRGGAQMNPYQQQMQYQAQPNYWAQPAYNSNVYTFPYGPQG